MIKVNRIKTWMSKTPWGKVWSFAEKLIIIGLAIILINHLGIFNRTVEVPASTLNISTTGQPSTASDPTYVYLQGKETTTREIVVQPATTDLTGLKLVTKDGKLYADINGKIVEVPIEQKQSVNTSGGQLQITDQTTMHLRITAPKMNDEIGLGIDSKKKPAGLVVVPVTNNMGLWVAGSPNIIMAGVSVKADLFPPKTKTAGVSNTKASVTK